MTNIGHLKNIIKRRITPSYTKSYVTFPFIHCLRILKMSAQLLHQKQPHINNERWIIQATTNHQISQ